MISNNDDLDEYIVIIWNETGKIHKVLDLVHITLEGAFRKARSYNKKFSLFINIDEAVKYLERFYMNQTVVDTIKEIVETDYGLTIHPNITIESKIEELGIDSLESFNLLYSLERIYGVQFENKFTPITIKDIVTEIEELLRKK